MCSDFWKICRDTVLLITDYGHVHIKKFEKLRRRQSVNVILLLPDNRTHDIRALLYLLLPPGELCPHSNSGRCYLRRTDGRKGSFLDLLIESVDEERTVLPGEVDQGHAPLEGQDGLGGPEVEAGLDWEQRNLVLNGQSDVGESR